MSAKPATATGPTLSGARAAFSAKPAALTAAELDTLPVSTIVWWGLERCKNSAKRGPAGVWRDVDKDGRYRPGFTSYTSAQLAYYGPRL